MTDPKHHHPVDEELVESEAVARTKPEDDVPIPDGKDEKQDGGEH